MKNSIFVIKPYKWNGISNAEDSFLMVFSASPFPDADFDLDWVREDGGGNVYRGRFDVDGELQEMAPLM